MKRRGVFYGEWRTTNQLLYNINIMYFSGAPLGGYGIASPAGGGASEEESSPADEEESAPVEEEGAAGEPSPSEEGGEGRTQTSPSDNSEPGGEVDNVAESAVGSKSATEDQDGRPADGGS